MNTHATTVGARVKSPVPAANDAHQPFAARYGLLLVIATLVLVVALPNPPRLPIAGQYMLGILAFAVIGWMTEAVSYPVSAIVITTLTAFMLGFAPNLADPKTLMGTSNEPKALS